MWRRLTESEIVDLAARNNVRGNAVGNFLGSMGGLTESEARGNLRLDTGLYRWNKDTVQAVEDGINLAAGESHEKDAEEQGA